jgi:hypothetical protein
VHNLKREDYQQLELFSQTKNHSQKKTQISYLFLKFIWVWEKTILIIIGLVITGIISFSLGVERGKRIAQLKTDSRLDIALKTQKAQPVLSTAVPKQIFSTQQSQPVKKEELQEYLSNYTIQVASFLSKTNAQKEADTLKRRGLSSIVLPKGKFSVVCVGNFSQRKDAESLLLKLKKQYQDCLIRRL